MNNQLTTLPKSIGKLKSLRKLMLESNWIELLPKFLAKQRT